MGYDQRSVSASLRALPATCLVLLLCAAQLGCITTPIPRRGWLALETPHFEILTTYGEADAEHLARELEQFRAAAEHLWGRTFPAAARRTRVIAYDGNGSVQPFRLHDRGASYLVAGPGGDTVVFRSRLGWSEDAPSSLRLELARRWFRNARPQRQPPWLVEGLAQMASTTEVRGPRRIGAMDVLVFPVALLKLLENATQPPHRVHTGLPRFDHLERLQTDHWVPVERVLSAGDLAGWTPGERELFEAESWLIAHYLKFETQATDSKADSLETLRGELRRGVPADAAARAVMGRDLSRRLPRYAQRDSFDSTVLAVASAPRGAPPRERSEAEVEEALGELALALGQAELARRYFADALESAPDSAPLRAGLGAALALQSDPGAAGEIERALEAEPDDPAVLRRAADAERAMARSDAERAEIERHAEAASELYRRALEWDGDDPALHVGLAEAQLLAGNPNRAVDALRLPRRRLPGDPELQRLVARTELARGERDSARRWALKSLTHARRPDEVDAAQSLLETIDSQLARH